MVTLPRTPSFRLDGRRALVTGAGRGIGLAVAAALAGQGAHVTLVARNSRELEEAVAAIRDEGGAAEPLVLDIRDRAAVAQAIAATAAFDVLVNNAGMNRPAPFVDVSEVDFDALFDLNVRGAFFVAQAVTRKLLAEGKAGSIINMSSQMGHVGAPNRTVYCASKHAIEGFTKALALELGGSGIRVNSICPTFIETPLTAPFFADPAFKASVLSKIQTGRIGRVEDLMGAVILLASDAAALMTGAALKVDGGWTAG